MQSTGSTSSQPSHDSLSSSDSFLLSDAEAGEDESEVFLSEGEASRGARSARSGRALYGVHGNGVESPGSQWACDGFGEPDRERSEVTGGRATSLSTPVSRASSSSGVWSERGSESAERGSEGAGQTEGDRLFARKCRELQGFVRPLLELLNGLKKGRFDKGLSSFQQSVAMDRIQRIVGVLQKPHIGEKYLQTLLQVEMMLKLWFPHVAPQAPMTSHLPDLSPQNTSSSSSSTPPHKHKDQLHIPVKKRRLSWSDIDSSSPPPPVVCKRFRVKGESDEGGESSSQNRQSQRGPLPLPTGASGAHGNEQPGDDAPCQAAARWSEPGLTWVHVAPIFSAPPSCPPHEGAAGAKMAAPAPPSGGSRRSPATQDSSVSSTTPSTEPGQPSAHHSPPVATEIPGRGRGRGQSPPITTKPSSWAEPSPVQT